jgi:hypothetical protein
MGNYKITTRCFSRPEQELRLVELAAKFDHLFPHWLIDLAFIGSDSDECDGVLSIKLNFEYFSCAFFVNELFFVSTDEEQEDYFIHEICHLYTTPVADLAKAIHVFTDSERDWLRRVVEIQTVSLELKLRSEPLKSMMISASKERILDPNGAVMPN